LRVVRGALWLTAICLPAIVIVVLRAPPVLAGVVTVTVPLPLPPLVFMATHVAPASLAVVQAQPVGAVTVTDLEPPDAE
jgi:hypothetical protein